MSLSWSSYKKNFLIILCSTSFISFGNGMFNIIVGKLLYDRTGSSAAFGLTFIIEALIGILLQVFAGTAIDKLNPKWIMNLFGFIKGFSTLLTSLLIIFTEFSPIVLLGILVIIINFGKPFERTGSFVVVTEVAPNHSELMKLNGYNASLLQAGQILGAFVIGLLLSLAKAEYYLILVSICYIASATSLLFLDIISSLSKNILHIFSIKENFKSWKKFIGTVSVNKKLVSLIILNGGDYNFSNFFTLSIVPATYMFFNNDNKMLSYIDVAYALGAILSGLFISKISRKIQLRHINILCMIITGLMFLSQAEFHNKIFFLFTCLILGFSNASSYTTFLTLIQKNTESDNKGKIAALRNFSFSLTSLFFIPIITYFQDISIYLGYISSAVTAFLFALIYKLTIKKGE